jgi:hypothetical protein
LGSTIVLFSSNANQFLIGGAFPTELFRLRISDLGQRGDFSI